MTRPILSREQRILVNGDRAEDADDCVDAEAAREGKNEGNGLLPFSVLIDTGEYTPPPW